MTLEPTNRNTTSWNLAGTKTFRLSSRKLMGRWGTNLQNPSDRICQIYIPDKGKIFVQVDQAGAEALVVSYLTTKGFLRELFINGIKSHCYLALKIFHADWDKDMKWTSGRAAALLALHPSELVAHRDWKALLGPIKEHKFRYFISKKTCHASNYGMMENTFRDDVLKESGGTVALTNREAGIFLGSYHNIFPEIRWWHSEVVKTVDKTGMLHNLFGFPREFYCLWVDNKIKRDAIAFVPQSTVGTITNMAVVKLQHEIETDKRRWDILNNKHDSYLVQVPLGEEGEAIASMSRHMEADLVSPRGERFKMKTEASLGYNWGKKTKDNPEGLEDVK